MFPKTDEKEDHLFKSEHSDDIDKLSHIGKYNRKFAISKELSIFNVLSMYQYTVAKLPII